MFVWKYLLTSRIILIVLHSLADADSNVKLFEALLNPSSRPKVSIIN